MRSAGDILKEILRNRGIIDSRDISEFLSDRPKKTYDPFLLMNMEAGVDLLLSEINSGSRICIYGDYDADGVTSICILSHIIGMLTDNFTYYIPSRFSEGYGLNKNALAAIKDEGTDLIVTVDCGSVSYEEVEYAKTLGMKIIVTDHHSIDDIKADCILINPKQKGCGYPFKDLAGCGVAFKMAQAIRLRTDLPKSAVNDVLDLAAIGTVGDIVSLTDENRTIVKYGLNRANCGERKALKKMKDAISIDFITSESIAYGIVPHINAAGRMSSAYDAAELFLTCDENIMEEKILKLKELNSRRKKLQEEAYERCMEEVSEEENMVILDMPDIHEGIAGIVAGKIKDTVNRPVIIATPTEEGFMKGTGRSIPGVDIYRLLKNHEEMFIRFGGHSGACGFLCSRENLEKLKSALQHDMDMMLENDSSLLDHSTTYDMEISPHEVTVEAARLLEKLEPFGQGNPKPLFRMTKIRSVIVKFLGEDGSHARFTAVSETGERADCILFQKGKEYREMLISDEWKDVIGSIRLQRWRGRESVQFVVEEMFLWK